MGLDEDGSGMEFMVGALCDAADTGADIESDARCNEAEALILIFLCGGLSGDVVVVEVDAWICFEVSKCASHCESLLNTSRHTAHFN